MLIPYYKLQVRGAQWGTEVSSVTIGPCPHPEASANAVHGLLLKHGIADGGIEPDDSGSSDYVQRSKIPYRNW
jgi:hypothetical protein